MVQFVGREAKYRWVILLRVGGSGPITIQSLSGRAMLGQSLPLFCPSSNVMASEECGGGFHGPSPGAFSLLYLLTGATLDKPRFPAEGVSGMGVGLARCSGTRAES